MFFPYKDDNPRILVPYVTYLIIGLNVLVFLFQLGLGTQTKAGYELTLNYGLIPAKVRGTPNELIVAVHEEQLSRMTAGRIELEARPRSPLLTVFTSMFMHGGLAHILFNMWFLWIFGDNLEGALGHRRYLIFYLLCGIGAALAQVVIDLSSVIPMIGASGAIAGVLGAYMVRYPRARVHVLIFFIFITTIRVPALYVLGFWFLTQLTNGLGSLGLNTTGGVAWFAHIGGFLTGILVERGMRLVRLERW